ncbi:MAG: hypothetical protein IFK94_10340 [Acidobacteria bacterium]|uniref:Uncharacterized protein n=1 Tax=Candidatus Polarisedimenticola svalbardensis TaxID=2886004 RepID=A0A8J6Y3D9_9BACT|nr:hypothetical protein [Candidatus Polarisedimenticola svalbardensis]
MNNNYSMDQVDGISVIRLSRNLNLDEVLELVDQVAKAGVSDRRLWDVTEYFKFTTEEVVKIATRGRQHWHTAARVAYLAADDVSFGLLRMLEVFRDEQEAMSWLKEWAG